jgi:hypothetical protein
VVEAPGGELKESGYTILPGVSAWDQNEGQVNATLNIIFAKTHSTHPGSGNLTTAPDYRLLSINPMTGIVAHNQTIWASAPLGVQIVQLGFA